MGTRNRRYYCDPYWDKELLDALVEAISDFMTESTPAHAVYVVAEAPGRN